jgi:chromosome segregation ATPase
MNNQQSQMIEEKNAVLTEQIERIKELENDTSTNKTAFTKAIDEMKARCEKAEAEAASLIKKASHIDTFSNQINRMNEEIRRKDSEIGVLNQEIKMLNDMIKELKNPPVPEVQPTKKKAK